MDLKSILLLICMFYSYTDAQNGNGVGLVNKTEDDLRKELWDGTYELKIRPSTTTDISLSFTPTFLNDLNINEEMMTMTGYYTAEWDDSRLDWSNKNQYSSIKRVYSTSLESWRPQLFVLNSITGTTVLNDDYNKLRIEDTGRVVWDIPVVARTFCSSDITFYPFDTQTCSIVITTWSQSASEVDLKLKNSPVVMSSFQENGKWKYVSSSAARATESRDSLTYPLTSVYFTFQRRPTYILMTTLIPVIFLSFLGSLTFYVSVDSGEKIGYCLTVLIAYALYIVIISDIMPTTSSKTSYMSGYIMYVLAMNILSVPLTLFIIKAFQQNKKKPIPKSIRGLTSCFRSLLCETKPKCCRDTPKSSPVERINIENHDGVKMIFFSKHHGGLKMKFANEDDKLEWADVSRVWDSFFLRFYILLFIFSTVTILCCMWYGYNNG